MEVASTLASHLNPATAMDPLLQVVFQIAVCFPCSSVNQMSLIDSYQDEPISTAATNHLLHQCQEREGGAARGRWFASHSPCPISRRSAQHDSAAQIGRGSLLSAHWIDVDLADSQGESKMVPAFQACALVMARRLHKVCTELVPMRGPCRCCGRICLRSPSHGRLPLSLICGDVGGRRCERCDAVGNYAKRFQ